MSSTAKPEVVHQEGVSEVRVSKTGSDAEEICSVNDDGVLEKNTPLARKLDYSGAYEKTDPKEIALVKKLDRWIMVSSKSGPEMIYAIQANTVQPTSLCSGACTG